MAHRTSDKKVIDTTGADTSSIIFPFSCFVVVESRVENSHCVLRANVLAQGGRVLGLFEVADRATDNHQKHEDNADFPFGPVMLAACMEGLFVACDRRNGRADELVRIAN